jgi:hypothetical protein
MRPTESHRTCGSARALLSREAGSDAVWHVAVRLPYHGLKPVCGGYLVCRVPTPTMLHMSPTHHETSMHISPHETCSRIGPPNFSGFKFKLTQVNYSSQIKLRYWPFSFSYLPADEGLLSIIRRSEPRSWGSYCLPFMWHLRLAPNKREKTIKWQHSFLYLRTSGCTFRL